MFLLECMARDEIKRLMGVYFVSQTELADALGITVQTLNYQLNNAKKFDVKLEQEIYKVLLKKGCTAYQPNEGKMVTDLFLEFTSIFNQHLSIISNELKQDLKDDKIDANERARLLNKIYDMRENCVEELDKLEKMVRG